MDQDSPPSLSLLSLLPPLFLCPGCSFPAWRGICKSCLQSIRRNSTILPPPMDGMLGMAPLLFSFQQTHSLLRHWKEHSGSDLEKALFVMPEPLQSELLRCSIDYIVPIPQSVHRSRRRGQESARRVADFFSQKLQVPIAPFLALQIDETPRQAALPQWERTFSKNPFRIADGVFENEELKTRVENCVFRKRELSLLLVDDLVTSGNTLKKAKDTIHFLLPHANIWGASLGYRPQKKLQ